MHQELLHDRAALYVAGALSELEREAFEVLLEFKDDLRAHVAGLQEIGTKVLLADVPRHARPPAGLRSRILAAVADRPRQLEPDSLVATGPDGRVQWVNPAFTTLCGYTLEELRGRKPGELLQGPRTDPAAVVRIRAALQARRPCRESLLNYHKDGSVYRVDLAITPVLDDAGAPLWFVARERKLPL